ncbi:putative geraniol 8-hydroxylase [Helianthus annuus]|nr:putative geraniol 8-hydroxylase [Helianthus annuus]KAJ0781769.1 putative geraniol 8-hydroxylase [Helianthus annuus]
MELLLVILILLSIIFVSTLNLHRKSRLPPGPIGFPIIGNLFELSQKPHESLAKLAQKHGPFMTILLEYSSFIQFSFCNFFTYNRVCQLCVEWDLNQHIRLGSITSVVASTPDAARQILQRNDDACSSRPIPQVVTALKHPEAAILWMPPNQTWRAIRKALNIYLTNPHKLDNLSHLRQKVVDQTLEFVKKKEHVDIGKLAFSIALNQMSNTFLSLNVTSYDSDNINGFKTAIETAMEVQGKFNVADIFPVLKPLDPQNIRRQAKAVFGWLDEVIDGFVSERLKGELRFGDMLDSLLEYSRENEDRFSLIHIKALLNVLKTGF